MPPSRFASVRSRAYPMAPMPADPGVFSGRAVFLEICSERPVPLGRCDLRLPYPAAARTPSPRFARHPKCMEFERSLADLNTQREDDDELQMVGADINMKCPITMMVYQATGGMAPLKSKTCGHTYSKDGVTML